MSAGRVPAVARVLTLLGVASLLAAVLVPTAWLTGSLRPGDPRHLVLGAQLWRLGGCLFGIFLVFAARARAPAGPFDEPDSSPRVGGRGSLLFLVVAALLLRVVALDEPLWFDEIWLLVDTVRLPLGDLVRGFESDNDHPLYSALAWFSVTALGESPASLRLPAAVFGAAGVWALWAFSRRRLEPAVWWLPLLLLLVSRHHISFSQNARAYTALLFFTLLSSHFLLRSLESRSPLAWMGHGLTLGLCVYAHLTGAFVAAGHVAVLAYRWRRPPAAGREGLRRGVHGLVLGVLSGFWLYALVLPQMLHFFLLRPGRGAVEAAWTNPLWMVAAALESFGLPAELSWFALGFGLVAGLWALWVLWKRSPDVAILLVVPTVALGVAMVGLGRNLWPRLFFFQAGFLLLALGVVLRDLWERLAAWRDLGAPVRERGWKGIVAGIGLLAVVWLAAVPGVYGPKQDFPAAMKWVEANVAEDEPVLTAGLARFPYERYYEAPYRPVESVEEYESALAGARRGIVIYTFPIYLQSREPALWERLLADGRELARFPGTVGDGDVVVLAVGEAR